MILTPPNTHLKLVEAFAGAGKHILLEKPLERSTERALRLVEEGKLGRKSGEGYYRWVDGKAQKGEAGAAGPELAERILAPLLAATERCVRGGVVADADLADAGVIFGTGFAPFTGGPLNFLRQGGFPRRGGAAALQAVQAGSH